MASPFFIGGRWNNALRQLCASYRSKLVPATQYSRLGCAVCAACAGSSFAEDAVPPAPHFGDPDIAPPPPPDDLALGLMRRGL
jgi:hypothetical protein